MSEEMDGANGDGDGGKVGGKKMVVLIVLAIVLIGGIGAGLYFTGMIGGKTEESLDLPPPPTEHSGKDGVQVGEDGKPVAPQVTYYELPEFLVNLQSTTSKPSFLKMVVTLEVASPEVSQQLTLLQPRIEDAFQVYLRQLRPSDLKGSAGIYRLRQELMLRLNKVVHPLEVQDILFKELLIQ